METFFFNQEGLRVILHRSNELPLVEEQGQDILPATATSFGVEVTEVSRLPYPYSAQCISAWSETAIGKDKRERNSAAGSSSVDGGQEKNKIPDYSMVLCGRLCILQHVASVYSE